MAVQTEAAKYEFDSYCVVPVMMHAWGEKWTAMFVTNALTSKLFCFPVVLSQALDVTLTRFARFNLFLLVKIIHHSFNSKVIYRFFFSSFGIFWHFVALDIDLYKNQSSECPEEVSLACHQLFFWTNKWDGHVRPGCWLI